MTNDDKFKQVMTSLTARERELSLVLPNDLPFDRFIATTRQALIQFPDILQCSAKSITLACMKAAYDGLRIDGREAAIVVREIKGKGANQGNVYKTANYMPMAFGLVQQIYRGGEVKAMEVEVVYESDEFHYQAGTNSGVHHIPNLERAQGEKIKAAYSVATLKSGHKTFEVLGMADLAEIRAAASTDFVWKNWPGEMSKKSAVRRHRKMLPMGDRDVVIRDAEQDDVYGDGFNQDQIANAAKGAIPPRPTRSPALEDQSGTGAGMPIPEEGEKAVVDAARDLVDNGEIVDAAAKTVSDNTKGQGKPAPKKEEPAEEEQEDDLDARIEAAMEEAEDASGQ